MAIRKRFKTVRNVQDAVHETFPVTGEWAVLLGEPTTNGLWTIWGKEKNGKTLLALMLANYFSPFAKFLYVSAEEGTDKEFADALKRAGITHNRENLLFDEYISFTDLKAALKRRDPPRIVLIDNLTIYEDEIKKRDIIDLIKDFPHTLFILLAHEERGEPAPAIAKQAKKLSKIYYQVKGMKALVGGRCPGGEIDLNEEKAALYHGQRQTA